MINSATASSIEVLCNLSQLHALLHMLHKYWEHLCPCSGLLHAQLSFYFYLIHLHSTSIGNKTLGLLTHAVPSLTEDFAQKVGFSSDAIFRIHKWFRKQLTSSNRAVQASAAELAVPWGSCPPPHTPRPASPPAHCWHCRSLQRVSCFYFILLSKSFSPPTWAGPWCSSHAVQCYHIQAARGGAAEAQCSSCSSAISSPCP